MRHTGGLSVGGLVLVLYVLLSFIPDLTYLYSAPLLLLLVNIL
jgi:hypothetical protein